MEEGRHMKYIWVFILSIVVSLSLSTVGRRTINDNFLLGFLAGSPALYLKGQRRDESRAVDDAP